MMTTEQIAVATNRLIDALKATTGGYGLGNGGDEYRIVIEIFLYKYFNDKFGYEAKHTASPYQNRLQSAARWDEEYDRFSDDEMENLFTFLPASAPRLRKEHTIAHVYNAAQQPDFSGLLDSTLESIAALNAATFSVRSSDGEPIKIFSPITTVIPNQSKRNEFALALVRSITDFNFEDIFAEKYDFFSRIFEYLIKDYNKDGGGKYAEYYTPRAIAQVMARLLVPDNTQLRGVTVYDPAAGTGTLLMALAHQIGEDRCTIFSQDVSAKSSEMLRLNLILNNLSHSLPNIVQGNTLTEPAHRNEDATLREFDFIVSNPPFKLDFPEYRDTLDADATRFWAGVPRAVTPGPKPKMAIYTCFIQHVINSLSAKGKGAIVVPTGFITAKSGVEGKILQKIVDEHIVYGCISMPSNVFATTGTNVSVVFFDKSRSHDKVVLIDASKLGEEYKDDGNQRTRLRDFEIDHIIRNFTEQIAEDDFSVVEEYDNIKAKNYSLSAGQYFDIKIEYSPIMAEEFADKMADYKRILAQHFAESRQLEQEILSALQNLHLTTQK